MFINHCNSGNTRARTEQKHISNTLAAQTIQPDHVTFCPIQAYYFQFRAFTVNFGLFIGCL